MYGAQVIYAHGVWFLRVCLGSRRGDHPLHATSFLVQPRRFCRDRRHGQRLMRSVDASRVTTEVFPSGQAVCVL